VDVWNTQRMPGKVYVDWGKLVQIALIIVAVTVLGVAGVIGEQAITGILGLAAGYIFGNGKSVREGLPPAPLIGRKPADDQTWALEDDRSTDI
jgi:hypothetical protein